jgi:FMN phosphatase YigB (HAD superfamily)
LATSALRANQQLAFDRFGLHRYFDAVVTAEDVGRTKPDPEPYLRAAEQLGVSAQRSVAIEDYAQRCAFCQGRWLPCDRADHHLSCRMRWWLPAADVV